ncbi:MAG: hypothetical protein U5P41_02705 [Gammaproteobacteria bacterium]|nr:hypothetical protein [Gammaproteobacteria bacterium]
MVQARGHLQILAGLALGILLAVMFLANRQAPTHGEAYTGVPAVSVIEAQPLAFRIEARGHGVARPAESWQAIANVPGRVVERHPQLESGALLQKGTRLLALDPDRHDNSPSPRPRRSWPHWPRKRPSLPPRKTTHGVCWNWNGSGSSWPSRNWNASSIWLTAVRCRARSATSSAAPPCPSAGR